MADFVKEIDALTTVLTRQVARIEVMVGNIRDLRFSNPTVEEVQEMAAEYRKEKEFAYFTLSEVKRIARA